MADGNHLSLVVKGVQALQSSASIIEGTDSFDASIISSISKALCGHSSVSLQDMIKGVDRLPAE